METFHAYVYSNKPSQTLSLFSEQEGGISMIVMYTPSHKWHYVNAFKERFAKGRVQGSERIDGLLSWKTRCKEKHFCIIVLDALPREEQIRIVKDFQEAPFHIHIIWTEGNTIPTLQGTTNLTQETISWKELSASGMNPHITHLKETHRCLQEETDSLLVGTSKVMEDLKIAIRSAGEELSSSSPMLVGETGTGKSLAARLINQASQNKGLHMVTVNCSRLCGDVGRVLLFGSSPGAFTGAVQKKGLLGEANGTTLFLDELQTMSPSTQQDLLDVVETHTYRKLGETGLAAADFLLITALNEDPFQLMARNRLREDLFHRLSGNIIFLPPLRVHKEDIPLLITTKAKEDKPISPHFLQRLYDYDWPGNVRELETILRKAEHFSRKKDQLDLPDGPLDPRKGCPWPMHRLYTSDT